MSFETAGLLKTAIDSLEGSSDAAFPLRMGSEVTTNSIIRIIIIIMLIPPKTDIKHVYKHNDIKIDI